MIAVAAMAVLGSCSTDGEVDVTPADATSFTAKIVKESPATRTVYDDANQCALWSAGDVISINGKTFQTNTPGATTTFELVGADMPTAPYTAFFACEYDGTTSTLPSEISETYTDGQFNMPMYAYSTNTTLEFKNLCGVLKITVKNDQIANVKSIKVSSSNKAVSGAFTVENNAAVLTSPSTVANTVTVTYTNAVATTAEGKVFYVAVPAQTYRELKMEVSDGTNTKSMTTTAGKDITVERSNIYPITFKDNSAPVEPEFVEIGGLTWATKNLGATTIAGSLSTCAGDYYQWGSVNKLYTSITWNNTTATFNNLASGGFNATNREYTETNVPNNTLPDANDVVKQTKGDGWRMPTSADFAALYAACGEKKTTFGTKETTEKGIYWCPNYGGVAGILFCDGTNKLFFPAAGQARTETFSYGNTGGYYWSSSLSSSATSANALNFSWNTQTSVFTVNTSQTILRYFGLSIRPVKGTPAPQNAAIATINGENVYVEYVQLWAGGPKWAKYNVGVTDGKEESLGGFYCWGGYIDKDPDYYYKSGKVNLTGDDDTATKLWGNNWCMPTKTDFDNLISNCTNTYAVVNGVAGKKFTGKGAYSGNSVFFPNEASNSSGAIYWSSNHANSYTSSYYLNFVNSGNPAVSVSSGTRIYSRQVRAILKEGTN